VCHHAHLHWWRVSGIAHTLTKPLPAARLSAGLASWWVCGSTAYVESEARQAAHGASHEVVLDGTAARHGLTPGALGAACLSELTQDQDGLAPVAFDLRQILYNSAALRKCSSVWSGGTAATAPPVHSPHML
jgi:hypothetical protein